MSEEQSFDDFKVYVDRIFEDLTYTNLREIITSGDKVINYKGLVDGIIQRISYFGPRTKLKSDVEWLFGIKKSFEIRKFLLNDYYDLVLYKSDNEITEPESLGQEVMLHYFGLLTAAVERISVLEGHGLNSDFSNVRLLVNLKKSLTEELSSFKSFIKEDVLSLHDMFDEGSEEALTKLKVYVKTLVPDVFSEDSFFSNSINVLKLFLRRLNF